MCPTKPLHISLIPCTGVAGVIGKGNSPVSHLGRMKITHTNLETTTKRGFNTDLSNKDQRQR